MRDLAVPLEPPVYGPAGTHTLGIARAGELDPTLGQASILTILRERWGTMLLATVLAATVTLGGIWFLVRPKYEVSAMIHVAPVVRPILFSDPETDISRNYRQYVGTEAANLVSSAVIDATINTPEVRSLSTIARLVDPVAFLQKHIVAHPVQATELLKVSMAGEDPANMVLIVNNLITTYLARREAKQREWDEKILSSLKTEQSELEAKLKIKTRQLKESNVDQGLGGAEEAGALMDRWMSTLQEQLTEAKKDRALTSARIEALVRTADPTGNGEQGEADASTVDPALFEEQLVRDPELVSLKEQLRSLEAAALGDAAAGRGPGHPEVQSRPELIADLRERIVRREAEINKMFAISRRRGLQADLRNAEVTTRVLEQELARLGQERSGVAGQRFVLDDLQHERLRLEGSLNQVREKIWNVEVEQGRAARIVIDSLARASERPNLDKRPKFAAIGLVMSFFFGAGVAWLRHQLDTSVRHPEEVTHRLGMRVLGSVQFVPQDEGTPELVDQRLAEPIRGISTALLVGSALAGSAAPQGAHSRLITSPTPGSGKSSLAMNLARSLAATGRRVLLIDADNHGRGISRRLELIGEPGLAEVLAGRVTVDEAVRDGGSSGLKIIPAGARDERFGDVLSRRDAQARLRSLFATYDEVILDSPPVLAKSDAVLLATLVDEVVLVLRAGQSTREETAVAQRSLETVRANVVGVVLNAVDPKDVRYGYSYYTYAGGS